MRVSDLGLAGRTKLCNLRELILRVQGVVRRSRSSAQDQVLEVDAFQVDKNKFEIRLEAQRLDLTKIE
jgi:DNA-binding response OmpR family regulator